VRCDAEVPDAHASFLAYGPEGTAVAEVLRVCATRWPIAEGFARAKGEVGRDQDEVRKWEAWHRHAALCLLAHAYLVVLRHAAQQEEGGEKGVPIPS
jgi:SRSO17 transposase